MKLTAFSFIFFFLFAISGQAQQEPTEDWYRLDAQSDNFNGVSSEKAYKTLLKGKTSQTVIVAVIDSGVDRDHEDLKNVMWVNPNEIPGNGIDDDKNGYIDDINGWNFLGNKDGRNVEHESLEVTRLYAKYRKKYGDIKDSSKLSKKEKKEYAKFEHYKKEVETKRGKAQKQLDEFQAQVPFIVGALNALNELMGDKEVNSKNLEALEIGDDNQSAVIGREIVKGAIEQGLALKSVSDLVKMIEKDVDHMRGEAEYLYNPDYDSRKLVGDNYSDSYEKGYGNPDVKGPDSHHGTHVAGIIGGDRRNDIGMKGIADNVRIMGIRVLADGDERDKDVANAILYAVDNGASVINMSFGKYYSWDKTAVDKALRHAEKNDVLLVHAAGNESKDNDGEEHFPTDTYKKKKLFGPRTAKNWIEVGASSWKKGEDMVAPFSNYGAEEVDVFAPGMAIYATTPENNYEYLQGTSMASPVVAGVASMIRSYFPELTARQVKDILVKSTTSISTKVKKPGADEKVPFSELSVSGGLVNAYAAVQMAMKTKGKNKAKKAKKPKA